MSAYYDQFVPAFEADPRQDSIKLTVARVGTEAEIDAAVAKLAATPGGGLIVLPDAYTLVHRQLIVTSTAQHRIPAIYSYRQVITEGGLMSYGPETSDIFRRSACSCMFPSAHRNVICFTFDSPKFMVYSQAESGRGK
jgi:putative ABC transport system substrate-binding protein